MKNSDFEISLDSVSCNENQSKTPEEIENDRHEIKKNLIPTLNK